MGIVKRGRNCDEGQVTIDYLIAITIFLFAIFFVFQYTSGLFTPFQSDSDEVTLIADRTAVLLVENMMSQGDATVPNLVNSTEVDSFFADLNTSYDDTIETLGLRGTYLDYDLNVTLENETDMLYSQGKALSYDSNIGQTKRVVLIRGNTSNDTEIAMLSVRVW